MNASGLKTRHPAPAPAGAFGVGTVFSSLARRPALWLGLDALAVLGYGYAAAVPAVGVDDLAIAAYPQGGGAYIVGADNLGEAPGLTAESSLLVGYILTVAVSSCSGAAAVASAFPELAAYKPWIAFVIVCILTWGNLRGMRESAIMFGVPTYFFIFAILALIVTGFVRVLVFG